MCSVDNTGHARTLSKPGSAGGDFELQAKTIAPSQFEVSSQSPSCLDTICLDENGNLEASPMTEPARRTLKTTESGQIDTPISEFSEQARVTILHNKGSDSEPQISEAELPHKLCDAISLDTTPMKKIRARSSKSSVTPLPQSISRNKEFSGMDKESNLSASTTEHNQHDASYIHSRKGTPDDNTAIEPTLPATQMEDGVAEPDALAFSLEEMDRIGAMLYREADAALRDFVNSPCEEACAVEPDSMVSTSLEEHYGQDSVVDPHGGRLEPAGNERQPNQRLIRVSVQFQDQVNRMMAELCDQVEDKAEDFGLASLRRKPLGEWYTE
ncbi:hypothetical protein BDV26DRAFT_285812 [Aspergillus bertholletiae]|uniref:Uncharacterized protein n=1 Tax=Aspergillus bertholletiae TaxID=1226010 RepID=A0A5N7ARX6_9EURO|nr:hypothetical protein BDV26DRAFT_285812 [Aspergillus bertholletiae]